MTWKKFSEEPPPLDEHVLVEHNGIICVRCFVENASRGLYVYDEHNDLDDSGLKWIRWCKIPNIGDKENGKTT